MYGISEVQFHHPISGKSIAESLKVNLHHKKFQIKQNTLLTQMRIIIIIIAQINKH